MLTAPIIAPEEKEETYKLEPTQKQKKEEFQKAQEKVSCMQDPYYLLK